jgi:hypothetical protein
MNHTPIKTNSSNETINDICNSRNENEKASNLKSKQSWIESIKKWRRSLKISFLIYNRNKYVNFSSKICCVRFGKEIKKKNAINFRNSIKIM